MVRQVEDSMQEHDISVRRTLKFFGRKQRSLLN
jgi:hypothetical protein